jgi:hypothetical protein
MTPNRVRDLVGLAHAARTAPLERPGHILAFVKGWLMHGAREPDELDVILERAGIPDAAWRDAAMWARPPAGESRQAVRAEFLSRHDVKVRARCR